MSPLSLADLNATLQLDSLDHQNNRAHVLTSDGGKVVVALKSNAIDSAFVEFEGIVDAPNQLREEARCEFGSSFGEASFVCGMAA